MRRRILQSRVIMLAAAVAFSARAQPPHPEDPHSGHGGMTDMNPAGMFLMNLASGTSANPPGWPMPMIMRHYGNWNAMFMGTGFLSDIQQSGPRGGDKLYSTNWFMGSAAHRVGADATFSADVMLSLEPATVTARRYPLLFQTGETAYGLPVVDAQHPHNFIMSLGVHYTRQFGENTTLDLYAAPVGDPALGPVAFPHRASAAELPQAPISHHYQDSTHISDDVVTAGLQYKSVKLEASGFHGAEPGENRWTVQSGPLDSWSARLWVFPTKRWAAQVSFGRISHPEALEPGDQTRLTASLEYTLPLPGGSWSSSLIWGRVHRTATGRNLNAYLAESVLPVTRRNLLTGRIEFADKDELFSDEPAVEDALPGGHGAAFRIGAYTIGYTRDVELFRHVETGIGVNFTAYSLPPAIQQYDGNHPAGGNVFVRFRLREP